MNTKIRLYFYEKIQSDLVAHLNKDQSHYLKDVMRLKVGDLLSIFNNQGEWNAIIESYGKDGAKIKILKKFRDKNNEHNIWLAFTLIKQTSGADKWSMFDAKRNPFNEVDLNIRANQADAEVDQSNKEVDYLSNGIKLHTASGEWNSSGSSYIYMAFAESPFVTSTGIPTTAR